MTRAARHVVAVALVVIAATSCTSLQGTSVLATFDLYRTPKKDCLGPSTCHISFILNVQKDENPGTNIFSCDLRALDERGTVIASGKVRATLGSVGMVPYEGVLSPKVRQSVASIEGTCVALDPEQD